MATLYLLDGTTREVTPAGTHFTLDELYALLNCSIIEVVPLGPLAHSTDLLVCDEEGKLEPHICNEAVTRLWHASYPDPVEDYLAGIVLRCSRKELH